jgi:glucose dehydrogenase
MSTSPADGMVDPDLRTHDHPNLYVVGSSVFRSMGHITPTLTGIALGLRLGAHLREI